MALVESIAREKEQAPFSHGHMSTSSHHQQSNHNAVKTEMKLHAKPSNNHTGMSVFWPHFGSCVHQIIFICIFLLLFQGVVEFSLCLFFAKLVSYTFLYWLPTFILSTSSKCDSNNSYSDDDDSRVFPVFVLFPVLVAVFTVLVPRQVQMPVLLHSLFPFPPRYFGRRPEKL